MSGKGNLILHSLGLHTELHKKKGVVNPIEGLLNGCIDLSKYHSFFLVDFYGMYSISTEKGVVVSRYIRPCVLTPEQIRAGEPFTMEGAIADVDTEAPLEEILIHASLQGIKINFLLKEGELTKAYGPLKSYIIDLSTGKKLVDLKPMDRRI
jgi:hypothetical protein